MPDWREQIRLHLQQEKLEPERREEVVEDLACQFEDLYRDALADGDSPGVAEARVKSQIADLTTMSHQNLRAKRRSLGGVAEPYCEKVELAAADRGRLLSMLADIPRDLLHGARMLRRTPILTAVAVTALALGIGANAAIFSVVNSVLLEALPYRDASRLVAVLGTEIEKGVKRQPTSPANFLDWKEQSRTLEHMTTATIWSPTLLGQDEPAELDGLRASSSLFHLLQAEPILGTIFGTEHGTPGGEHVVVLGHALWQGRLGGDTGIVGRSIDLDGIPHTVLGVMPPGFQFPPFWATDVEIWTPLIFGQDGVSAAENRGPLFLRVFARLRQDATIEQAAAEMDAVGRRLAQEHPRYNRARGIGVESLKEPVVSDTRPALVILLAAVGLVLLIACANVANLLLAHATARRQEIAVRSALGAGRERLIRQLLTESALLAFIGGVSGIALAYIGVEVLVWLGPASLPRIAEVGVDRQVIVFTLALSVLTGLVFGLAPALQASRRGRDPLRQGGREIDRAGGLRRGLVVVEVGLALVLLLGAGLLLSSLNQLWSVDPGFRAEDMLTLDMRLHGPRYEEASAQNRLFDNLLPQVLALPGVQEAGLIHRLPMGGDTWGINFTAEAATGTSDPAVLNASPRIITPDLFGAMGIPLIQGRDFGRQDVAQSPLVAVVSRTFAEQFWRGENAVGKRFKMGRPDSDEQWLTIVGIVGDVHQDSLTKEIRPEVYFPYKQNPFPWFRSTTLVIRATMTQTLAGSVRAAVWEQDASVPVSRVATMEQILSRSIAGARFNTLLLGIFGMVALLLSAVGVYGVISWTVSRRTREFGLRMALGAQPGQILGIAVREGVALALAGTALGLLVAVVAARFLQAVLFEVSPTDPATYVASSLLLLGIVLLACYMPARRATRIDPTVALRYE